MPRPLAGTPAQVAAIRSGQIVDGKEHQAEPIGMGSGHEVTNQEHGHRQGATVVV